MKEYRMEVRISFVEMQPVMPFKRLIGCVHNDVELAGDQITDEEIISAIRTIKNSPLNSLKTHWRFP